jgi:excisionase family DNA binding protein
MTLIKIEEVAKMIGFSKQGVYALVHKKKIPVVKISRRAIRFDVAAIEDWIKAKTIVPMLEASSTDPPRRRGGRMGLSKINDISIDKIIEDAKKEVLK